MLSRLYDALRAARVPEEQARAAAEEVATYEIIKQDTGLPKWMVGRLTALVLGVFWMQWQTLAAIAHLDARLGTVENRLSTVEGRLDEVETGLRVLGERTSGIEQRLPPS
jgi:hypothetical protein